MRNTRRIAMSEAMRTPSFVIATRCQVKIASPGVRKRLKTIVRSNSRKIAFIPRSMKESGTRERPTHRHRKTPARRYPGMRLTRKREMMKARVTTSLTRGSRRWITDSAG